MNNPIPLPNKIYFAKEEKYRSVVIIEPLYPGYGVTIGNALRRVLLSSLPGAAVIAVKIKGIDHEFSTIPNVREDVVDIILNLKKLHLKLDSDEAVRLELRARGQKEVTAKDFKPDPRVEIINSDLLIATLDNKNAELVMEIIVQRGRGYVPVEAHESEKLEIGMIAVDAIYTPMRNVNFEVENVRVGQITNYDKLTITMETDGTITGREAMDICSQILVIHFSLLKTAEIVEKREEAQEEFALPEEQEAKKEEIAEPPRESDLQLLGLSARSYNALLHNRIYTIEDLRKLDQAQLEGIKGLGVKSIKEILETLEKYAPPK